MGELMRKYLDLEQKKKDCKSSQNLKCNSNISDIEKNIKYKEALEEVLFNLRSIEMPNIADSYIDDSIRIII